MTSISTFNAMDGNHLLHEIEGQPAKMLPAAAAGAGDKTLIGISSISGFLETGTTDELGVGFSRLRRNVLL